MIRLHVHHSDWQEKIYALGVAFSKVFIRENDLELWKMRL
jgi:hypothetical protein